MAKLALPFFSAKKKAPKKKKGILREWFDALLWAAGAAILIRTFLLEAYVIPTGSMERSLRVGDFLFVSKFHYGTRLPMVPLAVPFVHNTLPGTNTPSFLDWITFGYARLPGISSIKRNDVVVFNYPADDIFPTNKVLGPVHPPSVKENYIKRCVAVPGDSIELKAGDLYINGALQPLPPEGQMLYNVKTNNNGIFNSKALERLGIRPNPYNGNADIIPDPYHPQYLYIHMPPAIAEEMRSFSNVVEVRRDTSLQPGVLSDPNNRFFPYDRKEFPWNVDWLGPVLIPGKGMTIELTPRNAKIYERCIKVYEGHEDYSIMDGKAHMDGKPLDSYTFTMNYYYMMGDNRRNSEDSRVWGFVPESHVVGKPLFVFFSRENGIRWERFFKGVD